MVSRSRMPESCRIWKTGLPVRLNSACTSSYCRSSTSPCSLTSERSGLEMSSGIAEKARFVLGFAFHQGGGIHPDGLGQFQFLEFGLDGDRVLRLGHHFLA